jgi:hypothetical protein
MKQYDKSACIYISRQNKSNDQLYTHMWNQEYKLVPYYRRIRYLFQLLKHRFGHIVLLLKKIIQNYSWNQSTNH